MVHYVLTLEQYKNEDKLLKSVDKLNKEIKSKKYWAASKTAKTVAYHAVEAHHESSNESVNEAGKFSKLAQNAIETLIYLDAEDLENVFGYMSRYFLEADEKLDNMDAKGVSKALAQAESIIKKRTGN